ncbi:MAG: hypothetical protein V3T17_17180 [Pseudomonadales bacterium]
MNRVDSFSDDDGLDFNVEGFKPSEITHPAPKKVKDKIEKVASDLGFTSRQVGSPKKSGNKVKRKRGDGRTEQLNIRCKLSDANRFNTLCNDHSWVLGQLFEYAIDAIEEKINDPSDVFWRNHLIDGHGNK